MTSSMSFSPTPERSTAWRITCPAIVAPCVRLNAPRNALPIGVRAPLRMTASFAMLVTCGRGGRGGVACAGARRRGARSAEWQRHFSDERQSRRASGATTRRAAGLSTSCVVALRSQSAAFVAHRSSHLVEIHRSDTAPPSVTGHLTLLQSLPEFVDGLRIERGFVVPGRAELGEGDAAAL